MTCGSWCKHRPGRLGRPDVLVGLMSVLQDDAGLFSLSAVYAECRVGPGVPGVPLFYHKEIDEQDLYFSRNTPTLYVCLFFTFAAMMPGLPRKRGFNLNEMFTWIQD